MLANQEVQLETLRRAELAKMNLKIQKHENVIRDFELKSATQSGSIGTLENLRKESSDRIKSLEEQIEALNSKSSTSQQNLNKQLKGKQEEIDQLNTTLTNVKATLKKEEIDLGTLVGDLRPALGSVDPNLYGVVSSREAVILYLNEELLFRTGSVSKLSNDGKSLIGSIAEVLQRFPALEMEIIGHTDNSKPNTGYSDNWTISVIRAVEVTKEFVSENGLGASQVTASGKGEYAPMGSNEVDESRKANRRVELHLKLATENLIQKIKKITG